MTAGVSGRSFGGCPHAGSLSGKNVLTTSNRVRAIITTQVTQAM